MEHKRFAVAVHYRNVDPNDVDHVIAAVRELGRSEGLRVTTGRKVIELRPNIAWDKGTDAPLDARTHRRAATAADPESRVADLHRRRHHRRRRLRRGPLRRRGNRGASRRGRRSTLRRLVQPRKPLRGCRIHPSPGRRSGACGSEPGDPWELVYEGYDPTNERLREALCTVGNGYVATRGCAPEAAASEAHYPGTYATGVYNILTDRIAGRTIENESLVNLPNWLSLTFRIDGGPWFQRRRHRIAVLPADIRPTACDADPQAAIPGQRRPDHHADPAALRVHARSLTCLPCRPRSAPRIGRAQWSSDRCWTERCEYHG